MKVMYSIRHETQKLSERAVLVGTRTPFQLRWEVEDYLDELELLADTAGADVVGRVIQDRRRPDPAFFIGKGKADLLSGLVSQLDANLAIFDDDLSPAQIRNLENSTHVKILDRSALILDIFAGRAKTKEARTQVELAQLQYLLPRLTRRWTHLSRQEGGIGTRGPGETQLETDRRMLKKRIKTLMDELEKIENQRKTRRKGRKGIFKVALVGYTNTGKSTLLNILSGAHAAVENRLFVTLDPIVRMLRLNAGQKLLLIDTVGFIRKLPHNLVASFKSTLEETTSADMLLHVVDISHPHFKEQIATVRSVFQELEIGRKPTLFVFNKVDLLEDQKRIGYVKRHFPQSVTISAKKGIFLEDLRQKLLTFIEGQFLEADISVDPQNHDMISAIYREMVVLGSNFENGDLILHVRTQPGQIESIRQRSRGQKTVNLQSIGI
ncbi:GTPase HflX [bacterium BMS3Abin05]|nr:GTPase HflX [bacterium BMS3Abin05]GBE28536.1 GTPase HflX [bacterium BMS3Bbin03]HDZ10953.1 GTPase HflX [Bacteroidota bacterium]